MSSDESEHWLREAFRASPGGVLQTVIGVVVAVGGPVVNLVLDPSSWTGEVAPWALAAIIIGALMAFLGFVKAAGAVPAVGERRAARIAEEIGETVLRQREHPLDDPSKGGSGPQDRMVAQIDQIVRRELRQLERRGLRTQWLFFAAGVPVGVLINLFVK